eukprot:TRINITY_DN12345_c0_g1_i1.p1 TRINITY_DN12345_c0_g1~~TRINITY_DN12345_c0_g1_i1.p1  ORF type:complete len:273 (+),score=42.66 TRINITY_DN12345_c0_g1_i1:109-927(+)
MASKEGSSKRPRKTSSTDPYELLYWPVIPGRGEFIRVVFEATETPYIDVGNATKNGIQSIVPLIKPLPENGDSAAQDEYNPPPLAPPILRHGSLLLSQTPNILLYLGPRLGLVPDLEHNPDALYHVNALTLTALDGLSNEVHETHHPIATSQYYEHQKPEAVKRATDYRKNRLPKYLAHFERILGSKSSGGGGWLYGGQMSYADLVLFQGIDGVSFAFPKTVAELKKNGSYEKVFALYERVKALDNIKKYLSSERRQPYSEGIWRHYPELEE